jgi:hypothetical protein
MWVVCHFENVFWELEADYSGQKNWESSQDQKKKMIIHTPLFIFKGHGCFVIRVVWKVEDM